MRVALPGGDGHNVRMAVLVADAVSLAPCDDPRGCQRVRCHVTERDDTGRLRVTVLDGCGECEGSTVLL